MSSKSNKKTRSQHWKDFKKFVQKYVDEILEQADLPDFNYEIRFVDDYGEENIEAQITTQVEYQQFTLTIFGILFDEYLEKNFDTIFFALCHEIGHLHTSRLFNLITNPYKTQDEVRQADEELTTKIGNYIYKICQTSKKPKKTKKR